MTYAEFEKCHPERIHLGYPSIPFPEEWRYSYDLDAKSVVVDVGGFKGMFAKLIYSKYGSEVHVFEPVEDYYKESLINNHGIESIKSYNYGLSDVNESLDISPEGECTSTYVKSTQPTITVQVRRFQDAVNELGIDHIDLLKINIEGGEFGLVPHIIESGFIHKIKYLQIQFHKVIPNAEDLRMDIKSRLHETHEMMWDFPFVWESWKLRE